MLDTLISSDLWLPARRPGVLGPTNPHDIAEPVGHRTDSSTPHVVDRLVGEPGREAYAVFSIDAETGQLSIRIVDALTEETIRQLPAEDLVRFAQQTAAYLKAAHHRSAA